jgi:hypothetical protein
MPKREQKANMHKIALHRGHDDSHGATMGTDLGPKKRSKSSEFVKHICLHRGTMEAKPIKKNYK